MSWFSARAAVLGAVLTAVVATHIFTDFPGTRVKVVRQPVQPATALFRVPVNDPRTADLREPFALIARLENPRSTPQHFTIVIDGSSLCERQVGARSSQRMDCVVSAQWSEGRPHEVAIAAESNEWTLQYLELASHHGSTIGAFEIVVLPAASTKFGRPGPIRLLLMWLVVTSVLLIRAPLSLPRWLLVAHTVVVCFIIVIVTLCVVSQWVSPYRVIFSLKTATLWFLLVAAQRVGWLLHAIFKVDGPTASLWTRLGRSAAAGAIVAACYVTVMADTLDRTYHGNYSGFLRLSRDQFDKNPLLGRRDDVRRAVLLQDNGGYDGQFMYFAAFDPFLREYHDQPNKYRDVMDAAPYRYGRIGFSLLTRLVADGHWQRYPATMIWLIVSSLVLTAVLLALLAQERGLTPAWGLLVLAIPGFWQSLQLGLPEPIAAATLVAGLLCVCRDRWVLAGLLLASSLLVRETGIVAAVCVILYGAAAGQRRHALWAAILAFGVLAMWRLYVAYVLYPDWGMEALLFRPPDLGPPFGGFIDLWRAIAHGTYYPGVSELSRAGIAYPLLLVGALVVAVLVVASTRSLIGVAALIYAVIAVCLNYDAIWVHVGNGQRGTYEVFLMLALSAILVRSYRPPVRLALMTFWAAAACYTFVLGFDASHLRDAMSLPF